MTIFIEITLLIALATFFAIIAKLLKQPLIIGYIVTGIFAGPYFLNLLQAQESIELFSKIGITILLFIVGLSLSPHVIREVGKVSLVTGIGQVLFTSLVGFVIATILGIDRIAALYIAIALTFSSTIIILKLLSDRGDLHKLYGRIAVGFLLVQDIIATIILLVVSSFAQTSDMHIIFSVLLIVAKGALVGLILLGFNQLILPKVSKFLASSPELLFLFSLAWGLGLSAIFYQIGLSIEIGALIAGVSLSLTPFSYEISARLKPIRDFFIVLFFVLLGSQVIITNLASLIPLALILSAFVLIGNPIIVIILMNLIGYKRKTSFMAGLTVAQISEFSLILATLGFNLNHIDQNTLSLITIVGIMTIAGSTYLILYADKLYPILEKYLKLLEYRKTSQSEESHRDNYDVILFGYDRVGPGFVKTISKITQSYLVVDFNPDAISRLKQAGTPHRYGDAEDLDFLDELNIDKSKLVISTIPDNHINELLTKTIRRTNTKSIIITISHDYEQAKSLYQAGATYVFVPHYLGAKYVSSLIKKNGASHHKYTTLRDKHMRHISLQTDHTPI
jgi:Kef-type K+ transport system membrane component KefB/Trk K+ transport system NAD-binding subunit